MPLVFSLLVNLTTLLVDLTRRDRTDSSLISSHLIILQRRLKSQHQPMEANNILIEFCLKIFSGPISEVEWVEKVVPVFGKIKIPKKDGNADSFCNKVPLVLTLVVGGCVLLSFLMKQKTIEEEKKVNKQKIEEQEQSSSRLEAAHVSQFKLAETGHFPHCR